MNLAETSALLTHIATLDNRRVDDAVVRGWHEILDDVTYDDARAAVVEHFGTSPAYLMPAHVRLGAKARVADRARIAREAEERSQRLQLEQDPRRGGPPERVSDVMARYLALLPKGHPEKLRRPEMLEWDRRSERASRAGAAPNPHYDPHVALLAMQAGDPGQ